MIETKFYILVPSHTEVLKMEEIFKKQNIKYTIVPTPSELSESCDISIMYNKKDEDKIKILIEKNGINIGGMHRLSKEKKNA
jgi:ribosomal protein L7Ae-like RNA K-turn-binding protein